MPTTLEPTNAADVELAKERRTKKVLWASLVVAVLAVIGLTVAVIAAGSSSSTGGMASMRHDRLTRMEQSGQMQSMLEQHQAMMEQMRAGLSPQMQQRMDADPMWKLMRSGEFTQMMEDQQRQIDRMLGRGAP